MSFKARQTEITLKIAAAAQQLPVLGSGLWFHHDIRDNFYYASYLFAAAADHPDLLPFEADEAKQTAEAVLLEVLRLQDRDEASATYGHWPLHLGNEPRGAAPNPLPVELMGSLMAYFSDRYRSQLSAPLKEAFDDALAHVYRSRFYSQSDNVFGHHDAKYTAAKLILGQRFGDAALQEEGRRNLQLTLDNVRRYGMHEYGSLPWFWHWVQAFTCAWQLSLDEEDKGKLGEMLDFLWNERALFYLKGAFVGAHSRGLKHDIPRDGNVLHDYVQFGDFALPEAMPRTEYAGFLYYEAPAESRKRALEREEPAEVSRVITKQSGSAFVQLHSYVYITKDFAAGGVWERYEEFDNEQHRWDISLPVDSTDGVNTAYFFHPSGTDALQDPRHQTGHSEVLFHKNTVAAIYRIPAGAQESIVGVLPRAEWLCERRLLLAQVGRVYLSVHIMQPYTLETLADRCLVTSEGALNGVVVEAISLETAESLGLSGFEAFAVNARQRSAEWSAGEASGVRFTAIDRMELQLGVKENGEILRLIGGSPVLFT
ncbi:hypothetical protein KP806_13765 [Paenibacillus sp. N4]|uniref:hypothetical protein n=1 Tax=Paenibacillus vietnamensis TaxID=2590547 RepID=UPI001CD16EF4|nr:hypothetical protein [Paenibacillus vietnamensis]MCA0756118.1 hypothetical protein [Paenibacillus vietnamensis]